MNYCFKYNYNYFGQNMHKNALFLLKNCKSHPELRPAASGSWGLCL